jgi:hypothetical protein
MVLQLALALVAKVIERAETAELTMATLEDEADALGATWKMTAVYFRATDAVQITAIASLKDEGVEGAQAVEVDGHMLLFDAAALKQLFGRGQQEANFQFVVPVPWAKAAAGMSTAAHG